MKCFRAPPPPRLRSHTSHAASPFAPTFTSTNKPLPTHSSAAPQVPAGPRPKARDFDCNISAVSYANTTDSLRLYPQDQARPAGIPSTKKEHKKEVPGWKKRNPILQDDPCFDPKPARRLQDWRSLTGTNTPKSPPTPGSPVLKRPSLYDCRSQSSIFKTASNTPTPSILRKRPVETESIGVMQYRFAWPYRDTPISEKPQNWFWSEDPPKSPPLPRTISLLPPLHTETKNLSIASGPSSPILSRHGEKLNSFGMQESQLSLIRQIRAINARMGRDENACIRSVKQLDGNTKRQAPAPVVNGFRAIDKSEISKPALTYLKSLHFSSLHPSVLPTQRSVQKPQVLGLSFSERDMLRKSLDEKKMSLRAQLEDTLHKRLEKLNKLCIFPKRVNEFRMQSTARVSLNQAFRTSSMREFLVRERERITEARGKQLSERLEGGESRRLLSTLEAQLVDKVAWAERIAEDMDEEDGPTLVKLTREQIDAKIAKMRAEGKRRAPLLAKTRALPTLNIAKELGSN